MTFLCRRQSSVVLLAVALLSAAAEALAQGIVPPPPQGLFGGIRPDARPTKRADLTLSLVQGYDDDVPQVLLPTLDPSSLQNGGFSTIFETEFSFASRSSRVDVGVNAGSVVRYFAESDDTRILGHNAGVGVSMHLPSRTTLFANQSAAFTPTYLSGLFPALSNIEPGDPGITAPNLALSEFESYTHSTTVTMAHHVTARATLTGTGEYHYIDRLREHALWQDVSDYALRGRYDHNVTQNTGFSTQVRYRSGFFGYVATGLTTEVGIDIGMSHSHAMSATRRTSYRFNVGVSGADVPESMTGVSGFLRQYFFTGDFSFNTQLSRTWEARAYVRRGLEYISDLPEPVFSDGVSVEAQGLLSRRVDVSLVAAFASGQSLLNPDSLQFDTYTGDVRVRFALTRSLATFAEYLYYYYQFRGRAELLIGMPSGLERNGARVGLTLWVPALRK